MTYYWMSVSSKCYIILQSNTKFIPWLFFFPRNSSPRSTWSDGQHSNNFTVRSHNIDLFGLFWVCPSDLSGACLATSIGLGLPSVCHTSCLTGRRGKTDWNWAVPELFIGDAVVSIEHVHRDSFVSLLQMMWFRKGIHKFLKENTPLRNTDIIFRLSVSSISMHKLQCDHWFSKCKIERTSHNYSSHSFSQRTLNTGWFLWLYNASRIRILTGGVNSGQRRYNRVLHNSSQQLSQQVF